MSEYIHIHYFSVFIFIFELLLLQIKVFSFLFEYWAKYLYSLDNVMNNHEYITTNNHSFDCLVFTKQANA